MKLRHVVITLVVIGLIVATTVLATRHFTLQSAAALTTTTTPTPTITSTPTPTAPAVLATPTPTAPPAVKPTATPTPTPTATPVPVLPTVTPKPTVVVVSGGAVGCRNGEVIGNELNLLDRTPVGLAENNTALEVSWKGGRGFEGYGRFNLVVPALGNTYQVFLLNVDTIKMYRYCGTIGEVERYLSNPDPAHDMKLPHVDAMQKTAADRSGRTPLEAEIGVYTLNLDTATLKVLKQATAGPTIDELRAHIEVVKISGVSVRPTMTPAPIGKCPEPSKREIGWDGKSPPDVTIKGPAIANLGWPQEGNTQVRVAIKAGDGVTFFKVGGAYWPLDAAACTEDDLQSHLVTRAGGLPIVTVDDLVKAGKARR